MKNCVAKLLLPPQQADGATKQVQEVATALAEHAEKLNVEMQSLLR